MEETERSVETIKASAEEEANRIRAEARQTAEELAQEIRATAQKEMQNALRTKREQFKRYYKQVYKELVANLDSITEITNSSTDCVSVVPQDAKLPQFHSQPVMERAEATLSPNGFRINLPQYLVRFFDLPARWLKSGYLAVRWLLQPEIRQFRKAASRLKECLPHIRLTQ
jgi:vacuolar-type H+-ATPase subunit H